MSDVIKIRNKLTGEIVTLRRKGIEEVSKPQISKKIDSVATNKEFGVTNKEIQNRGNLWSNISQDIQSSNPIKKVMGGLQTLGVPTTLLESGISNPMLAIQSGNFNIANAAKEAFLGFTGQKLGQYGDVMKRAGYNPILSDVAGLTLSVGTPLKVGSMLKNTFGRISKLSDKGILNAGNSLINATKAAENFAGGELTKAFSVVDDVKVDATKFYDLASKLPKPLITKLETTFGSLEDVSLNLNVGKLRQIKQILGKYKPGLFGKETRGLAENIEADEINKLYGGVKKLLSESVEGSVGKNEALKLLELEKKFTEVSRSSDYIKKTITDPTLLKATKGGAMAKKIAIEGDVSGRTAINTLKKSGKQARKEINKAVSALNAFNKWQMASEFGKHAVNAAMFGGAIGGMGGFVANKLYNRNED